MNELLEALSRYFLGPPKPVMQPEPIREVVVESRPIQTPSPPSLLDLPSKPPEYVFGGRSYRLGTWKTRQEAEVNARDLRFELKTRQGYSTTKNPWGLYLAVVPDLKDTFTLVITYVMPQAGDRFCRWLSTDAGPRATNEDGSSWVAWPAWTRRKPHRMCKPL